ncbi:hypothetical protein JVT61DRAFT_9176 [Boletus reticuloceps]|uniref:Uncharacterized protein n=1 Tax=Boletus reticuloceps TaxID=495285 RepID=A0A8I2YH37_9AGAM|nr:hypothetical protein JVT61DRAFT_9176 [Boletus reticuloceps]
MPRADEGAPNTISPILTTENSTTVSTGSVSRGTNVAEDDKQAKLDNLQSARKMQGSYEQPITQLSSDREGRASSDHMDRASIPNAHALVTPEPQLAPTLESFDVDSGTQVESTDSIPKSPLPLLTTPSGKDSVSSSSDAHGMQGSLDYAGEDLDTTMLDRSIERIEKEEVHMDTSRELPLQNHDTYITSATKPNHGLSTEVRRWESTDHSVVHGEQQTFHELSVASVGAPTNEQNTVSHTSLQESTIETERSVVMKGTEYKATDTESGQSNLVVCPPMLRGNDQGIMDRCPAPASTSPIDLEVHNPPSLDGDLGITNSSSTIWMTRTTNEHFSGVQRPPLTETYDMETQSEYGASNRFVPRSLDDSDTHSFTDQSTEVVDSFYEKSLDTTSIVATSSKELADAMTGVRSHSYASSQETTDNNLHTSTIESESITWTSNANGHEFKILRHRVPSLDYMEEFRREWDGVDLYDIAERGVLSRCLSRPSHVCGKRLKYWMNVTEQETEWPDNPLNGVESVLVCYYAPLDETAVLALAKTAWRIDVLGASRWPSIVRGWSNLAFVRHMCLADRVAHIIDHRLFVDDRAGAIVRTNSSGTVQRPIVIAIARAIGRLFDDDALAARILSCIDLYHEAPQNLGLLCIIPQKTKETVIALNDMLHGIKDILRYRGIDLTSMSIDELDMGYWIKVTMQKSFWCAQPGEEDLAIRVGETEDREQGVVEGGLRPPSMAVWRHVR